MNALSNKYPTVVLLWAGFFALSCGSQIGSEKFQDISLNNFQTYAFLPNQDTIRSRLFDNSQLNELLILEINNNMKKRGYRLDRTKPDLLVIYHLMMDEETPVNENPVFTNYSYYQPGYYVAPYYRDYMYSKYFTIPRISGTRIEQVPYKEGTLVIDIIARREHEILWRGTAKYLITSERPQADLRTYVKAIYEAFPDKS